MILFEFSDSEQSLIIGSGPIWRGLWAAKLMISSSSFVQALSISGLIKKDFIQMLQYALDCLALFTKV